ncbi:glycosyltransferase [Neiella marina]|uniref:Glycosyltransferase n=1 Tax=Neiella holothuriorum TaxID=2870530 RepID=A0ABS7EG98_9GAMM|nr:glycosyltransferase [Neiella holothuriorum]MBW8190826.1 glycosyltransferase [Neiella holothuriorum]
MTIESLDNPVSVDLSPIWLNMQKFAGCEQLKLNLGCGADQKEGWINIDSGDHFGQQGLDIVHDLATGIPFPSNSIDFIFHEHFIEHLTREQGKALTQECFRVLKPGGVLRIACPDLRQAVLDYLNDEIKTREEFVKYCSHWMDKSNAEILNLSMREWGHQYIYDEEDLTKLLREVGFSEAAIRRAEVGKSDFSELASLETRKDSLVIEAVVGGEREASAPSDTSVDGNSTGSNNTGGKRADDNCSDNNSEQPVLVSVLAFAYNHEKYIAEALESWLMQRCDFKFEIVIGEDCSTDSTLEIIERYQEQYPDIVRVVSDVKNVGSRENFLRTAVLCKGKYVAYCEGDDYWIDAEKLQKQVDFLEANDDYSTCFHAIMVRDEQHQKLLPDQMTKKVSSSTDIYDLAEGNYIHTPSVVFRNPFKSGFPEQLLKSLEFAVAGDYIMHMYNAQFGKIKKLPDVMAVYRVHPKGLWSSRPLLQKLKDWTKVLDNLIDNFSGNIVDVLKVQREKNLARIDELSKQDSN